MLTPFDPRTSAPAPQPPEQGTLITKKSTLTRNLRNWGIYVLCFNSGLVLAFIPRLFPGMWIVYGIAKASLIGYLMLVPPANPEFRSLRRLSALALAMSFVAGNWDAWHLSANLPFLIPFTNILLPVWIIAIAVVAIAVILLFICLSLGSMSDAANTIAKATTPPKNPFS